MSTTFTARWVPIDRVHGWGPRPTHRAVCGMPAGCPGLLGEWDPLLPDRLHAAGDPVVGRSGTYYIKVGPDRYRLPGDRTRAPGQRHPGSRPDPRAAMIGSWPVIRGRQPVIPTTIVCPVCGRDNAIVIAPESH